MATYVCTYDGVKYDGEVANPNEFKLYGDAQLLQWQTLAIEEGKTLTIVRTIADGKADVDMGNLPTSDPGVSGLAYNDSTVVTVSA